MSLRKIVLSTSVMASVNVLRLAAQFFAVPILARLLSPADYGLVGMAMPFLTFALVIADAGVGMSLVRASSLEHRVSSTCFWLSVALGAGLAAGLAAMAPLAAFILDEPRLGWMVMALGLVVVAQGIAAVPMSLLQKVQRFQTVAAIEIAAVITGIATAIYVAFHRGGAWALVDQQIAFFVVRVVLTIIASRFRPLLIFDLTSAREHMTFGRDVLGVNILYFFMTSMDNLIIGTVRGVAAVGLYSMAAQFARLPRMAVTGPLQYVAYSQLSGLDGDLPAIRRAFLALTRSLAALTFPVIGMFALAYQPAFELLLSRKWLQAGELFSLMAPASAAGELVALCGTVMLVIGRTDIQLRYTVEFGVIWLLVLTSTIWLGLEYTAIASSFATILYSPRYLRLALPLIGCSMKSYLAAISGPAIASLACMVVFAVADRFIVSGKLAELGLGVLLAVIGIFAGVLPQYRAILEGLATASSHPVVPSRTKISQEPNPSGQVQPLESRHGAEAAVSQ